MLWDWLLWKWRSVATSLLLLALSGCTLNPSKADVIGKYELEGARAGRITLLLRADGSFVEDIRWKSNREEQRSGVWNLVGGNVSLSELWIPSDFAPAEIVDDHKKNYGPTPKFTDPGHWVLGAEKRWGVVFMPVFPDEDVEFRKF